MKRSIPVLILLCETIGVFAQEPAAGGPGRGTAAPPSPPPLFFKELWKKAPGNVPVTQDFLTNPDLILNTYGVGKEDFGITSEGDVPHIWTGQCASSCVLTLSHKDSYVDLSGKARIRWYTKTSGFHEIRPVLKLADGTWLIGDHIRLSRQRVLSRRSALAEARHAFDSGQRDAARQSGPQQSGRGWFCGSHARKRPWPRRVRRCGLDRGVWKTCQTRHPVQKQLSVIHTC